jgi:hypothetical protein
MWAQFWNVTDAEKRADYPAHRYAVAPYLQILRAIDIAAPPSVVFRWLCQLKVAPYSYDWLDNWGRRSPRTLTPGTENLALGQRMLIGRIVEVERDRQITFVSEPGPTRVFGAIAGTYRVGPTAHGSRLICCLDVTAKSWPARVRAALLAVGDLVMMRKQLLNLKELAERAVAVA